MNVNEFCSKLQGLVPLADDGTAGTADQAGRLFSSAISHVMKGSLDGAQVRELATSVPGDQSLVCSLVGVLVKEVVSLENTESQFLSVVLGELVKKLDSVAQCKSLKLVASELSSNSSPSYKKFIVGILIDLADLCVVKQEFTSGEAFVTKALQYVNDISGDQEYAAMINKANGLYIQCLLAQGKYTDAYTRLSPGLLRDTVFAICDFDERKCRLLSSCSSVTGLVRKVAQGEMVYNSDIQEFLQQVSEIVSCNLQLSPEGYHQLLLTATAKSNLLAGQKKFANVNMYSMAVFLNTDTGLIESLAQDMIFNGLLSAQIEDTYLVYTVQEDPKPWESHMHFISSQLDSAVESVKKENYPLYKQYI